MIRLYLNKVNKLKRRFFSTNIINIKKEKSKKKLKRNSNNKN